MIACFRFVSKCVKAKKKEDIEDIFVNPALVTAVLLIANFGLFIVDRILWSFCYTETYIYMKTLFE